LIQHLLSNVGLDTPTNDISAEDRRGQLDAARDRAELLMAADLTRFKHPNDLVTLALAEVTGAISSGGSSTSKDE
jgi:hypothetical protein